VKQFFKWIKQHLKVKSFVGTSRNAVMTQSVDRDVRPSTALAHQVRRQPAGVEHERDPARA